MKVNPYTEILARKLYRKDITPINVPIPDRDIAKDAVRFMNCQTFVCVFKIDKGLITMEFNNEL